MHGAWPTILRWDVVESDTDGESASLLARLDWDRAHPAFELFPFPHRLEYRARAAERSIELALALEPTEDVPVPVSFGFHPYLRIPGGARHSAEMTLPVRRAHLNDDSMLPTGETEPFEPGPRRLGDTEWDDEFSELDDSARFVLRGGESEISLTFLRGYPFAHVFAPADSDFVCFEPMTAPTNALVTGTDLAVVAPGGRYEAAFEIAVG
jgi:galactose mutarotase-like enzyme